MEAIRYAVDEYLEDLPRSWSLPAGRSTTYLAMREDGKLADGDIRTLNRNRLIAGVVNLDASKLERYQGGALEYLLSHSL
jgi:hypothetical protein